MSRYARVVTALFLLSSLVLVIAILAEGGL